MSFQRPPAPVERSTTLRLNGTALLTVQTTPIALEDWALGFLFTEGLIADAAGAAVRVDLPEVQVQAAVSPGWEPEAAGRRYLTSGCGKGVTFSSLRDAMALQPLRHQLAADHAQLLAYQQAAHAAAELYQRSGGIHSAAVAHTGTDAVLTREDIGRHSAVDKALGAALRAGWDLRACVLVTSGRISYDMCAKLARAGVAMGVSRTAATDQAVRLADRLGITLIGYLRPTSLVLYADRAGRLVVPAGFPA